MSVRVSVVVVTHGQRAVTERGLGALAAALGDQLGRTWELILVDNAFAFGELFAERTAHESVPDVRAFNDLMAKERALQSVIVPLGDGLWVGVKR